MTKPFRYSKIQVTKRSKRINQESPVSRKFVTDVLIFRNSYSQMFFKRGILQNFAKLEPLFNKLSCSPSFTEHLRWLLLDFRDSKHFFSAELGIYWTQSHRFLFRTPLKTRVKPQKQPLELFCKKRCSQKFCKFHRETPLWKSLFNRVPGLQACNFIRERLHHISCLIYEFLRTPNYKSANDCF